MNILHSIKTIKSILHCVPKQPFSDFPSKLNYYSQLCRYDKPIGYMLLFWPTAWGVCLGSPAFPSLYYLALFFMGSVTSRAAGCIVNDYLDRDVDRNVERTKDRPLASGKVTNKEAFALTFANLTGGLIVLTHLPLPVLGITMGFVGLAGLYPLAKRYTNYPQLVLGVVFNSGIIISSLTMSLSTPLGMMIPLYISGICWTLIYDTIYAFQDIKDDLKLGMKSTAITWQKNPKQTLNMLVWVNVICHGLMVLSDPHFIFPFFGLVGCDMFLFFLLHRLDIKNPYACWQFFKYNNYYGLLVFLVLAGYSINKYYNKKMYQDIEQQK